MKKQINPNAARVLLYVIVAIIGIATICALLSSCEVIKGKKTHSIDTSTMNKMDSGNVRKSEGASKSENEWWKESLYFNPGHDTTINHYTTITQPAVIIREGGKNSQTIQFKNSDSSWRAALDSMHREELMKEKTKETMVLSPLQIIAICIGGSLLLYIILSLGKSYLSKFKIVKV